MKFPTQLKILGHIFKVQLVDPEDIEKSMGEQNNARNIIRIRKDIPKDQVYVTLIHEILHCINDELKEVEVEFLAQTLYAVLVDNDLLKD